MSLVGEKIADIRGDVAIVFNDEYAHGGRIAGGRGLWIDRRAGAEFPRARRVHDAMPRQKKWPKEAPLGERASLGPNKATAPITVIGQSLMK
ncbi:MAG: hypothetical protein NVV68_09055 [Dokdonella sp.]|nr:hypothetical protein [Dokdonella sp.]